MLEDQALGSQLACRMATGPTAFGLVQIGKLETSEPPFCSSLIFLSLIFQVAHLPKKFP